jgi:hypothetical protein
MHPDLLPTTLLEITTSYQTQVAGSLSDHPQPPYDPTGHTHTHSLTHLRDHSFMAPPIGGVSAKGGGPESGSDYRASRGKSSREIPPVASHAKPRVSGVGGTGGTGGVVDGGQADHEDPDDFDEPNQMFLSAAGGLLASPARVVTGSGNSGESAGAGTNSAATLLAAPFRGGSSERIADTNTQQIGHRRGSGGITVEVVRGRI